MKRIVFMGTPDFAADILEELVKNAFDIQAKIVGVYCQADKPAGRGKKMQSSAVKLKAEELSLPLFQPLNFKEQESIDTLVALEPDVLIVAAYGLILPESVLAIPKFGAYNVHASLLPQWRGAAPVQRGILAGDIQTGITIMRMEKGLDTGDMLLQKAIMIAKNDTAESLLNSLANAGARLMISGLKQIFDLSAAFIPQNNALATYAQKILKEEYLLNWNTPSFMIDRKVRALYMKEQGARIPLLTSKGEQMIQILQGEVVDLKLLEGGQKFENLTAGTILVAYKESLIIATQDSATEAKAYALHKVKPVGKKVMAIKDFINGYV